MFVETRCKCRIAIPSHRPVSSHWTASAASQKNTRHPLLFSTNKRHCDFACVEKLPIPCSNKKVAVDKTLQCHLEENSPKRILPARLLRWQRDTGHPGIDIDTADPSLERTLTRSAGQFGEKFSTSKMTEFLIRNWRQKVWVWTVSPRHPVLTFSACRKRAEECRGQIIGESERVF